MNSAVLIWHFRAKAGNFFWLEATLEIWFMQANRSNTTFMHFIWDLVENEAFNEAISMFYLPKEMHLGMHVA